MLSVDLMLIYSEFQIFHAYPIAWLKPQAKAKHRLYCELEEDVGKGLGQDCICLQPHRRKCDQHERAVGKSETYCPMKSLMQGLFKFYFQVSLKKKLVKLIEPNIEEDEAVEKSAKWLW